MVFDLDDLIPGPLRRVRDFPAGTDRLTADAPRGLRHVLVNGAPARVDGRDVRHELADLPGQLLRRGAADPAGPDDRPGAARPPAAPGAGQSAGRAAVFRPEPLKAPSARSPIGRTWARP